MTQGDANSIQITVYCLAKLISCFVSLLCYSQIYLSEKAHHGFVRRWNEMEEVEFRLKRIDYNVSRNFKQWPERVILNI